ncbi:FKBP-like protein [Meredithblackwellia eburnea MCA 4105]
MKCIEDESQACRSEPRIGGESRGKWRTDDEHALVLLPVLLHSGGDSGDGDGGKELKVANSLKLRHCLCEKQSKSLEALAKIKEGVSFDKVCAEFSEDKARQGGSLGWMTRQQMMGDFQNVCFTMPVSTCAAPIYREIKTKFGYHIVIVEDRK